MRTINDTTLGGIERLLEWMARQPSGGSVALMEKQRQAKRILRTIRRIKDGK